MFAVFLKLSKVPSKSPQTNQKAEINVRQFLLVFLCHGGKLTRASLGYIDLVLLTLLVTPNKVWRLL
jgi:hypothetical protein